jgi:hypothetical protein
MHTIDLLKGQGLPAKTTLVGSIIIAVAVIVPIVVVSWMLDSYLRDSLEIGSMKEAITKNQQKLSEFAQQIKQHNESMGKRALLTKQLTEVSRCVNTFVQWSPLLITVAQKMPGQMTMNSLIAQCKSVKSASQENKEPNKPLEIVAPERSMLLETCGKGAGNYDTIAKDYLNNLKVSDSLSRILKNDDFSFAPSGLGEQQAILYKMNFTFKNQTQ